MPLSRPAFAKTRSFSHSVLNQLQFILLTVIAGFCGAMLELSPMGLTLEEDYGLTWLFKTRGALTAPKEVVIIGIDRNTMTSLATKDSTKIPRQYYVQLLQQLSLQHPAIIGLDIHFKDKTDPQIDQQLAAAIAHHGNIILGNYLKNTPLDLNSNADSINIQTVVESFEEANEAALGSAPFLVPKAATTVRQFWINKDSAGDTRTLPDIIFQGYVFRMAYTDILYMVNQINPTLAAGLPKSFEVLAKDHQFIAVTEQIQAELLRRSTPKQLAELIVNSPIPEQHQRLLNAWVNVLNSKSLYFNYYGDVGSITTIPFHQALNNLPPNSLNNKVIIIGYSEDLEPEKAPGYYSVFSLANNQTISTTEIVATAVGNLIGNASLVPLDTVEQFFLLLSWGALLAAACQWLPYRIGIAVIIGLSGFYGYAAYYQFSNEHRWLPLIIPLVLQCPIAIIASSIFHFRKNNRKKNEMESVLHNFLPEELVKALPAIANNGVMDTTAIPINGICLATDICDYTKITEALDPQALNILMNRYYEILFSIIKQYNGYVTDLAGDGMYAVWINQQKSLATNSSACCAALAVKNALKALNSSLLYPLMTRFGFTSDDIHMTLTGTPGRYVYRAVGDAVNTASRIEGLNKHLGTQILVSAAFRDGLNDFVFRDLGYFLLKGKSKPIQIYELMMANHELNPTKQEQLNNFASALALFQHQNRNAALISFKKLDEAFPNDGPTQFFINHIETLINENQPTDETVFVNII